MKLHRYFLPAIAALLCSACVNDDTVNGPVDVTAWDIATFEGNRDGHAIFTLREGDDSPLVTLRAGAAVENDDLEDGDRVYIMYIPADNTPYRSGDITLRGLSVINQGVVTPEEFDIDGRWNADPVYVLTIWRTGHYINIYCRLPYSEEPRVFGIAADEASISSGRPQLYLEHELSEPVNSFERAYYASYDISKIWSLPGITGVDLHVNNSNLPTGIFRFDK